MRHTFYVPLPTRSICGNPNHWKDYSALFQGKGGASLIYFRAVWPWRIDSAVSRSLPLINADQSESADNTVGILLSQC